MSVTQVDVGQFLTKLLPVPASKGCVSRPNDAGAFNGQNLDLGFFNHLAEGYLIWPKLLKLAFFGFLDNVASIILFAKPSPVL